VFDSLLPTEFLSFQLSLSRARWQATAGPNDKGDFQGTIVLCMSMSRAKGRKQDRSTGRGKGKSGGDKGKKRTESQPVAEWQEQGGQHIHKKLQARIDAR
jgi:hypothetical protein